MPASVRYRVTRPAEQDLIEIARYSLETWGKTQRDRYVAGLFRMFDQIADLPLLGRTVPEMGKDVHVRLYRKQHMVYYRFSRRQPIDILRVLHVRQDRP